MLNPAGTKSEDEEEKCLDDHKDSSHVTALPAATRQRSDVSTLRHTVEALALSSPAAAARVRSLLSTSSSSHTDRVATAAHSQSSSTNQITMAETCLDEKATTADVDYDIEQDGDEEQLVLVDDTASISTRSLSASSTAVAVLVTL